MNLNPILFGTAYYDEYMPFDRIEIDMQMMKEAGMNTIRIAESTWSTIEPQDNVFDFSYLDRMLDASEKHQLKVILGTPTYAVPTWLVKKHPDVLTVTHKGQELYGRRQNMDITHPQYRHHSERVIRAIMEHTVNRTTIIGYQLDNETNPYDTCSKTAQSLFVSYLKANFHDLETLNYKFGLDYWSNRINSWEDFPDIRGTINGSLGAEYEKFQRSLVTDFLSWQADIISGYKKDHQFVTQNFDFEWRGISYGLKPQVNQFDASKCLTMSGVDIYHPSQDELTGAEISFGGAIARGLKQSNYLVLETQAQGSTAWLPYEGQLRLQAYSHLSSGSNSVMYWHWHSIHNSFETYWKGVLSHDFSKNATYLEAVQIGKEFANIGDKLINLKKTCRVAFMLNNESLTGLDWFGISEHLKYNDIFRWIYDALYRMNIECDIIPVDYHNLKEYDLIVLPALYSASETVLSNIDSYVHNGGNILATFKSGFSDEYLKVYHDTQPHILTKCCGIEYNQFTIPKHTMIEFDSIAYPVTEWMELLLPTTAETWANYKHQHWGKYAAVTHNDYGQGSATYFGAYFDSALLEKFLVKLLSSIHITVPTIHFPIICKEGINDKGNTVLYYFNYSNNKQTIPYPGLNGSLLLKNQPIHTNDIIQLDPWDVTIIEI